ncbi:hypothetical protein K449DRAFT_203729 [Hypoxylon sp. EC38]|nr:hypothetical protein K449DRAFT_203729 [Hypoxylon sp. EC38]
MITEGITAIMRRIYSAMRRHIPYNLAQLSLEVGLITGWGLHSFCPLQILNRKSYIHDKIKRNHPIILALIKSYYIECLN